ncbi:MAG: hypothetical protein K2Y23_14875, partial [Cyanobacteria bacterium]|nr:hypothetical protein [Cyanobacteriota bacterium]
MDPDKQRPIQSLEEARDWERVFIGEIKAGRDPRRPRPVQKSSNIAPKVALIRFRGHFPEGGYDVQNGIKQDGK